jgi:hypothetical protein
MGSGKHSPWRKWPVKACSPTTRANAGSNRTQRRRCS